MLIEHRGSVPTVHDSAYVAPSAVLCGDVVVGPGSRVLHGAVVTAEDGQVRIGRDVVIMENAVVKGRARHPVVIGDSVLVGPHAHVNGAEIRSGAFVATGASLFPGSVIGNGAEIRVNGVVQVNTTIDAGSVVPIGWVAVGTPATVRSPDQHRDIWVVQRELDFPGTVYGVPHGTSMRGIMESQSAFYGAHRDDTVVGAEPETTQAPREASDPLHDEAPDHELPLEQVERHHDGQLEDYADELLVPEHDPAR
ncbi:gamma carbonic anhydrase family protein [Sanguibacter antarcticus]|uniref:Carbonic anhydrase/acetyltransferase-like protein (Isoleucine patch superfamily) n=1 Tax=Sanguibacter antarcticus TaxID=372484 RepID=A0A2A9E6Z7_9MICO|nr:gamma carbonic anhydrase family protein [Sanguibacter antarcticus]PFG33950.1 carbonic anhydrase/acetyltransferase-like protein (isoleucine patch superfamily) [Sanguibacter antarcticus]